MSEVVTKSRLLWVNAQGAAGKQELCLTRTHLHRAPRDTADVTLLLISQLCFTHVTALWVINSLLEQLVLR